MNHFKLEEFECPCCQEEHMDRDFLDDLDLARELADVPFSITSGYRCEEHNEAVGGVPSSSHTKGYAVDIACPTSSHRYKIIASLMAMGFNRIGVSSGFIHVDCDPDKSQDVIWTYK